MISGLRLTGIFVLGMGILGSMMLPSEAGDYRGGSATIIDPGPHGGNFGSHGDRGHGPDVAHYARASGGLHINNTRPDMGQHHGDWHNGNRDRFFANHPRRLQRLDSGNFYTQRGSGITILAGRPDYALAGNDAGASDSFTTAAGTYSVGYGDYVGDGAPAAPLAPKAKIINIATMADPCAYESGVCVIRP